MYLIFLLYAKNVFLLCFKLLMETYNKIYPEIVWK